ncbi:MAG: 4-phosphopantoate--beta-alanine ligase, partial [Clostridiales bacterium]|nr:4-phosphopantoate--beta-alanine ligase [Clostridiales bacterium]
VFAPELDEMFSEGFCSYVDTSILTEGLFGVNSCDYYRGFCTVTTKLFNITSADKVYFGQKDAQHLAVIRRLVKDLNMKLSIIGCPVIREEDGLVITSKNIFLNAEERRAALILSKTIRFAQGLVQAGEKDTEGIIEAMRENIGTEPLARIDYIEIVDAETMQRVDTIDGQVLVAIAVYIGDIRLLDNFTT